MDTLLMFPGILSPREKAGRQQCPCYEEARLHSDVSHVQSMTSRPCLSSATTTMQDQLSHFLHCHDNIECRRAVREGPARM